MIKLPDGWLSVDGAAAYFGVSRRTVYRRVNEGAWPTSRLPGSERIRFSPVDLLHIEGAPLAA